MDYQNLQKWLTDLVSGLVSHPEEIDLTKQEDEQGILFVLKVHEEDRGKVIGKEGNIANAIRTVLRSAGRLIDVRASMKVDVPGSSFHPKDE